MASMGGKRIAKEHVVASYRRTNMRMERHSYGVYRGGTGCGCGLVAVAATEARHVKNEVSEGAPIFVDHGKVFNELAKEYTEPYIAAFMRGFDGDEVRGEGPDVIDNHGQEDGAAAYDACVAAGIEEYGEPKSAEARQEAYAANADGLE